MLISGLIMIITFHQFNTLIFFCELIIVIRLYLVTIPVHALLSQTFQISEHLMAMFLSKVRCTISNILAKNDLFCLQTSHDKKGKINSNNKQGYNETMIIVYNNKFRSQFDQ